MSDQPTKVLSIVAALAKRRKAPDVTPDADDERPTLTYQPENLHTACAEVVDVLATTPNVFERGGALVRVAGAVDFEPGPTGAVLERAAANDDERAALKREPRVIPYSPPTLRALLASRLIVGKTTLDKSTGEWAFRPCRAPDDLVSAILEAGAWTDRIPTLKGISETAFLRPDGTIAASQGFDRQTGYFLAPTSTVLDVADRPTQADAVAALSELEEVFADFPYVDRSHAMVPIAAILTLLARPAIEGSVPGFIGDASTRGSGKSLQTDAISTIAIGRSTAKMSWPPDATELEKVLSAYALRGAVLVNFDNVNSGFGGAPLDKCLTAVDTVELRVLGKSEVPAVAWRAVILATGNNVEILGDTTRRVLVSRVESPLENPEDRTDFRHPDLLAWVRENRPRLVRAALTILRGYVVAGRPSQGLRAWGSFEAWASLIPTAIVWAGGEDVMACRPEAGTSIEPEKAALLAVLEHWPTLTSGTPTTTKRALAALYPAKSPGERLPPDGYDDLRDALESVTGAKPGFPPTPKAVGHFLARVCGRWADGRRLARRDDRKGFVEWRVEARKVGQ